MSKHITMFSKCINSIINKLGLSVNNILGLFLFVSLILSTICIACICWLVLKLQLWTIVMLVGCGLLYIGVEKIHALKPCKFTGIILSLYQYILIAFHYIIQVGGISLVTLGAYIIVGVFSLVLPLILLIIINNTGLILINEYTCIFISFTLGAIISTSSYRSNKYIICHSPLRNYSMHKYEQYQEELAIYLVHPKNITFLIYLFYFVILCISSIVQIDKGESIFMNDGETAILKSFLVFMAYTNMRTKSRDTEIDAKKIFNNLTRILG